MVVAGKEAVEAPTTAGTVPKVLLEENARGLRLGLEVVCSTEIDLERFSGLRWVTV